MSIWQIASNIKAIENAHGPQYRNPRAYRPNDKTKVKRSGISKYTHWPNPFGKIERMETLLCGNELLVELEMFGMMAASFFFANFLPDPKELLRNWLTGKWRCGVQFDYNVGAIEADGVRVAGPLDILWADGSASVIVRGALNPLLQGAYFMWATGTAFAALSMFNTVLIELAACGADLYNVNLALGDCSLNIANGDGAFNGYNVLSDPRHVSNHLDGFVLLTQDSADFEAFGHVTSFGKFVDVCDIYWSGVGVSSERISLGPISPGEIKAWHIRGHQVSTDHGSVQVAMHVEQHGASIASTFGDCVRFVVSEHTLDKNHTRAPNSHDRRCWGPDQPPMALNPQPY